MDLKALALLVIERDKARDKAGTAGKKPVPPPAPAGQALSHADLPADWAAGLCEIEVAPCPTSVSAKRWRIFKTDCARFAEQGWARQASRLGWSLLDIFGVHPERPAERFDAAGVLWLVDGAPVLAVSDTTVTVRGSGDRPINIYRRRFCSRAIPAWELQAQESNETER